MPMCYVPGGCFQRVEVKSGLGELLCNKLDLACHIFNAEVNINQISFPLIVIARTRCYGDQTCHSSRYFHQKTAMDFPGTVDYPIDCMIIVFFHKAFFLKLVNFG